MKKNNFKKIMLMPALLSMVMLACKKEKEALVVDTTTPAYKIAQSEKLAIPVEVDLPANLPGGNSRVATYYAEGVQKYKAQIKAGSNPVTYEWIFVAPRADLFDVNNTKIGTHGAGPHWAIPHMQAGIVDSIFGQAFSPAKTAIPDANSIPWLQLMSKPGKEPSGVFTNVAYIQRIASTGGKGPVAAPVSLSHTADVPYTAVYRFTKKN